MMVRVIRMWLSSDFAPVEEKYKWEEYTDVIVELSNSDKFVSAFYTLEGISGKQEEFAFTGRNLNGSYFWEKNLVIVKEISKEFIKEVIEEMIVQGDFFLAFRKV